MRLLTFVIVLSLATLLGAFISHHPGYALFSYGEWTVEMPLWLTFFATLLILGLTISILLVFNFIFSGSNRLRSLLRKQKLSHARALTYQGLLELAEGYWKNAERSLSKSAPNSDTPLINYLSAAEAADAAGYPERRDHYLELALAAGQGSDTVVRLTQAKLMIKQGKLEQSVATVRKLYEESPKHPKVLELLCTLYEMQEDYLSLFTLLPQLKKIGIFSKDTYSLLELKGYKAKLASKAEEGLHSLIQFWKEADKSIQQNPNLIYDYTKSLLSLKANTEAEQILRTTLKTVWVPQLVYLYGLVISESSCRKQLDFMESYLTAHTDDSIFLLTLGRLCVANELWGKGRDYFERSLHLQPRPETYAELAQLMDRLGQKELREDYFRKGLLLAITSETS
jgi:HemY protein